MSSYADFVESERNGKQKLLSATTLDAEGKHKDALKLYKEVCALLLLLLFLLFFYLINVKTGS